MPDNEKLERIARWLWDEFGGGQPGEWPDAPARKREFYLARAGELMKLTDQPHEHSVVINGQEKNRLVEWLRSGTGSLTQGRVTFEAVAGGGVMIRARSFSYGDTP